MTTTPPDWYDDGSGRRRWWDGTQWTEHVEAPQPAAPAVYAAPYQQQVPLDQPLYGATFGQAVSRFWSKYATFDGRASRSEYWFAFLFFMLLFWVPLLNLAMIIPMIAVAVRRLHDTNRSGAFYFLGFIPLAGSIILIVLLVDEPVPAGARFDAAARYGYRPPPGAQTSAPPQY
ncbi:MAG: hypothetical protein BGO95_01495 [Micrococcales bacterium 73-13]|nr:MAG: hypothetical protein BGO95_01495 [Micrococcales bacterium 73-13]